MGCSISCLTFEKFSSFIHWLVSYLDHYLDDFFFAGEAFTTECAALKGHFDDIYSHTGVPIADEKTVGPVTCMDYLGLTIDTENLIVRIPDDKLKELLKQINFVAFSKKVTLKQLKSLCGILAFCT